jgi:uncharacterized Fe-S cluster-containing radical SAM superfamily protein
MGTTETAGLQVAESFCSWSWPRTAQWKRLVDQAEAEEVVPLHLELSATSALCGMT